MCSAVILRKYPIACTTAQAPVPLVALRVLEPERHLVREHAQAAEAPHVAVRRAREIGARSGLGGIVWTLPSSCKEHRGLAENYTLYHTKTYLRSLR